MTFTWSALDSVTGKTVTLQAIDGIVSVYGTPPNPLPDKVNKVVDGPFFHSVTGRDVPRGEDQIIVYTTKKNYVTVNQWGVDVLVDASNNLVLAISDTEHGGKKVDQVDGRTYVVSGHREAGRWLLGSVKLGDRLELTWDDSDQPQPPPVVPPAGSGSYPSVIYAEYLMDGPGHVSQITPECNRLIVAFYQDTDLVEWGGDSPSKTQTDIKAWEKVRPENHVLISMGGQGGNVNLDQVDEGMKRIHETRFPIAGIDFDAEAYDYSPDQAVSVCNLTSAAIGRTKETFVVQLTPPGGAPVDKAIAAAKALIKAGFKRVYVCHQLYDTDISDGVAMSAVQHMVDGVGEDHTMVGIMLHDSHASWDVASVGRRLSAMKAKFKKLAGMALWESSRTDSAPAMVAAKKALG